MTRLVNDPHAFAGEALAGFAAVHEDRVTPVGGGVVRAGGTPRGQVAVVLGGGSGHYPAFAGWVGPGFAHGAACGNTFASPSAGQIRSVARAAENGAGVLFGFGNYAGDVMQFGLAAERLRAEGIDARTLPVTDDVASAPLAERHLRRGVGGDLLVFKIACAAAEAGLGLNAVEAVARRANEATRSLGIAFGGCTLPGAERPLFTVARGQMAIGLGIHGEPGLRTTGLPAADEVADLLVSQILDDLGPRADDGSRVAVLVNGLGATKHEELFVVYGRIAHRLRAAGLTPVLPEVSEQVTSLDMAGLSLSLTVLDDELEKHWSAPADAPAFRRTVPEPGRTRRVAPAPALPEHASSPVSPASADSRAAVPHAVRAFTTTSRVLAGHEERLGAVDAVAGDGDHGIGMARGSAAAARAAGDAAAGGAGVRGVLLHAADAWAEAAGGSSGALWGAALTAAAGVLGDEHAPRAQDVVRAARASLDALVGLGGARVGDKTMVDAVSPFVDALDAAVSDGADLRRAWSLAARAAAEAAERTADLTARLGRARAHGAASLGTPDAGALSFALIVEALATTEPGTGSASLPRPTAAPSRLTSSEEHA